MGKTEEEEEEKGEGEQGKENQLLKRTLLTSVKRNALCFNSASPVIALYVYTCVSIHCI